MGTVYLGLPGPWAKNNREASDHYTNKIGGVPDWPSKELDIKPDLLACRLCGKSLCLVAQVYAPLSLNGTDLEERNIYIFGCSMASCANSSLSWRAFRVQKWQTGKYLGSDSLERTQATEPVVSTPASSLLKEGLGTFDNGNVENDESDMVFEELSKALSGLASTTSNCSKQVHSTRSKQFSKGSKRKGRVTNQSLPALPCFYIYSKEELPGDAINDVSASYSSLSLKGGHSHATEISDEDKWEGEVYEYDKALQADRTYLKFKKRVDLCPEQCFRNDIGICTQTIDRNLVPMVAGELVLLWWCLCPRWQWSRWVLVARRRQLVGGQHMPWVQLVYSFGGQPLLAAANAGECGTCSLCGAVRHYEMQLMPAVLYFLHQASDIFSTSCEEWDWMTVIIYTCSNSCFHQSYEGKSGAECWIVAEETVIVQDDSSTDTTERTGIEKSEHINTF